jgi:hypothetical protein
MHSGLAQKSDEKGVVLILGLWMLLILSILGAFAISTSITEMGISGNYRNTETAFNTADAAIEYAETDATIYDSIGTGSWPPGTGTNAVAVGSNTAQVRVEYMTGGLPPVGSGVDVNYFQANYFAVSATGTGPNNSEVRIEAQTAKIVPK